MSRSTGLFVRMSARICACSSSASCASTVILPTNKSRPLELSLSRRQCFRKPGSLRDNLASANSNHALFGRVRKIATSRVPLVPLKAAAGAFSDPQIVEDENWEWVEIETRRPLRRGMFVAQVVGRSMEPEIPDGAYCLFSSPVEGSRQGRTILVQLRDGKDPETGERYTVKRYQSEKTMEPDGTWHHSKITLLPNNPAFEPIILTAEDEGTVQVVAEVVEVFR